MMKNGASMSSWGEVATGTRAKKSRGTRAKTTSYELVAMARTLYDLLSHPFLRERDQPGHHLAKWSGCTKVWKISGDRCMGRCTGRRQSGRWVHGRESGQDALVDQNREKAKKALRGVCTRVSPRMCYMYDYANPSF
jgi:hypothetical protein